MSFAELNKPSLVETIDYYGLDNVDVNSTKAEIIAALAEAGVSWAMYQRDFNATGTSALESAPETVIVMDESEDEPVFTEETILLKMEGQNRSIQIGGYKWTQDHPFAVVTTSLAERIMRNYKCFRPAMPSEAESYYG